MVEVQLPLDEYEIDHIGIAVNSLEESAAIYKALQMAPPHVEVVESQKVKVAMYKLGNQANIELLEPTSSESPVAKFLDKKGPGIHHICLRVKNIENALQRLKEKGIQLIHETPFLGAHNCLVAFVHPKSASGVLVELSQPQSELR